MNPRTVIDELAKEQPPVQLWYVTGTYHGSHVYARREGDARRAFHKHYNGESIVHCTTKRCNPLAEE